MQKRADFGVSFSLHRARELKLSPQQTLEAAIADLGFRRFRLMSYWDIHEQSRGQYDFSELDWQMDLLAKHGAKASLCLGLKQPRWPEFHMPAWAEELDKSEWHAALLAYVTEVVSRYNDHPALGSWQLENEALLVNFGDGKNFDYDRSRLQREFDTVKKLDPDHIVNMSLSNTYGLPIFDPRPDVYGMSMYKVRLDEQGKTIQPIVWPWFYHARAIVIKLTRWRPCFIHELQAEPWVSSAIATVPVEDQLAQMGSDQIAHNLEAALATTLSPIDLWGLEWWYWLKSQKHRPEIWDTIKKLTST